MVRDIIEKNEKVNPNADLLKKLKSLIPGVIAKDGSIDADAIRYWAERATGDSRLVTEERETFNFLGKDYARLLYALDTETVITPDKENNSKSENKNSENLYLSGDNLEVLKHLRRSYEGEVKCIYIDPPYNTGSDDFVYNDSFDFTEKDLKEKLGLDDDAQVEKIMNMRKRGSRSHAAWLTFMYPRLKLARDLLKDDGVIFISIDDNEQANLKILCDEIFGEENFVGQLIIETATDNNPSQIDTEHEYMVCYCRDRESISKWSRKSEAAELINEQYQKIKEREEDIAVIQEKLRKWIKDNVSKLKLDQVKHYNNVDEFGVYSSSGNSSNPHPGGYMYNITHPTTHRNCPIPENGWRWPAETFWQYAENGQVEWGVDHTTQPHVKKRIETAMDSLKSIIYEDNRASTKLVADLFDGKKVFDNPKPLNVLYRVIDFATQDGDVILDFFSGSGTTAHSILFGNGVKRQNGKRKYIAVQIPESLDEKLRKSTSKSKKIIQNAIDICDEIHKPHTLDQIGMERIRRAAAKIKEEHPDSTCDFGFKHYTIQKPAEKSLDTIKKFVPNPSLGESTILKQFGAETVLATWMVDDGHKFNANVEKINLNGYTAYKVNDYLYLIDSGIEGKHIKELFKKYDEDKGFKPKHIVLFGYSFGMTTLDTLKANIKNVDGIDIHLEIRY